MFQIADGSLNETGLAEGHTRLCHALRQAGFHRLQRGFYRLGKLDSIRIGLFLNTQYHRRLTVKPRIPALDLGGKGDACHLFEQNRLPRRGSNRKVLQILKAGSAPNVADQVFLAAQFHEPARGIIGKPFQRIRQLRKANSQIGHAAHIRLYLKLAHFPTNRDDLRHASNRQQARA